MYRRVSLMLIAAAFAGCGEDGPSLPGTGDGGLIPPVEIPGADEALKVLGESCGIDVECKAGGIAEGNASVSGVASIDAFFQSVLNFEAKAGGVAGALDAEVRAIAADFGVEAGASLKADLQAKISASVEGGLKIDYQPAKCAVDAQATVQASARCEGEVNPGSVMVECKGSCEVEASADVKCEGSAMLQCTVTAPSVECTGTCQGSCEVELTAEAACDGTCTGSCSGTCSAYSDSGATMCAGKCDGMCMGSCKAELGAAASCSGKCEGECTVEKPDGGCEGGIRASCKAEANAMVMCGGRCDGEVEPPSVKAECKASASAEAKLNVECSPPRVAISYQLKAGLDAQASAQFEAAIKNLEVRLPRLLAASAKADLVVEAGEGLIASASGAVSGAVSAAAAAAGKGDVRVFFGLRCAVGQLDAVGSTLNGASGRLAGSAAGAADLTGALGM
jgi:hypothetical protein